MIIFVRISEAKNNEESNNRICRQKRQGNYLHYFFVDESHTEFSKFITKFKDCSELNKDFQTIVFALKTILKQGALERFFRPEGKMSDQVCALPIQSSRLRLYCLRLTDQIVIIGNGGEKTAATYEESEELNGYVLDLQSFNKIINSELKKGAITIEETQLVNIDNKVF